MKALTLQETTYAKDINGKPLVVGEVSELDPALGNAWACQGIVRVVEHDAATGPRSVVARVLSEPEQADEDGHIYGPDGGRDYLAERKARKQSKAKTKPKRKEAEQDGDDEGTTA